MNILLVNPPVPRSFYHREFYLPSSLLYIGAVARENGEEVEIVDFAPEQVKQSDPPDEYYKERLLEKVSEFGPGLIGFGGLFSGTFLEVLKLLRTTKENFPQIPTVFGGVHPTMYAHDILRNCPSLDWLVLGEGEETFVRLINQMKEGSLNLERLDGFAYRDRGKVRVNEKKKFVEHLDSLPFPAYDLVKLEDYYVNTSKWHNPKNLAINTEVPITSSRSCPNDCSFCASHSIMGRGWRARSAKNVVDEIELVYDLYNHRHFSFTDDNLTLNRQRTIDMCDEILKRELDIQFDIHNGVSINTLDDEVIDALASTGLTRIALPIESGSDYIRNTIMGKHLSREKIVKTMESLRRHKQVYVVSFFMIGMPEDTKETLMDTYNLIEELKFDKVHLGHVIPFPKTRVFEQAYREGLLRNINLQNMYRSGELYQANPDTFFIKPYDLKLEDLIEFEKKCKKLITGQKKEQD